MNVPVVKASFAVGALGLTGASGFGIYKGFIEPSTIKSKILTSYKGVGYSFLSPEDGRWKVIKDEYAGPKADNKPIKDGKEVTKEELPVWCEETVNSYFYKEESSKFNSVLRWCYVNTNSFKVQATALNKVLLGQDTADTDTWNTAWDVYKNHKSDIRWKISDGDEHLNKEDGGGQGGASLQNWCVAKLTMNMYASGAKDTFSKFEKFCLKDKNQ